MAAKTVGLRKVSFPTKLWIDVIRFSSVKY